MRRLLIALLASGLFLGAGAAARPVEAGARAIVRTETVYLSLSGLT
jgi:hypothetical protein